jgi:serine/threonine protein kinase
VNFDGIAQNSRNIYMFMEYVQGGELFTHLREEGMFEPHKAS